MYTSVPQENTVRTRSAFFLKPQINTKEKRKSFWFGAGASSHQRGAARGQVQCLSFWKAHWDDVTAARPLRQHLCCPCHPTASSAVIPYGGCVLGSGKKNAWIFSSRKGSGKAKSVRSRTSLSSSEGRSRARSCLLLSLACLSVPMSPC